MSIDENDDLTQEQIAEKMKGKRESMTDKQPTTEVPKRYDLEETSRGYDSYRCLVERADGDWVSYDDYAVLTAQVAALKGEK